mmetsp:Transcript_40210/g.95982  ORF Transcript_40210/g.95982 Transcript_40210/m.95982 type:complete len:161 (-) Transcript_40210:111-593(-)
MVPAFIVPVEVRAAPQYGEGHCGVFATAPIRKGQKVWEWTDLVSRVHKDEVPAMLATMSRKDAATLLRQSFVTPEDLDHLHMNPRDAGCFTNHSAQPTMDAFGALRDVQAGEELTMDYSWHGDPAWYRSVCAEYGVLTEAQIANARNGACCPWLCFKGIW